jgi:hypothetical protein
MADRMWSEKELIRRASRRSASACTLASRRIHGESHSTRGEFAV